MNWRTHGLHAFRSDWIELPHISTLWVEMWGTQYLNTTYKEVITWKE